MTQDFSVPFRQSNNTIFHNKISNVPALTDPPIHLFLLDPGCLLESAVWRSAVLDGAGGGGGVVPDPLARERPHLAHHLQGRSRQEGFSL